MIKDYVNNESSLSNEAKKGAWNAIFTRWQQVQAVMKTHGCVPPPPPQEIHGTESPVEGQCREGFKYAFYEVQIWASLIYYDQAGKNNGTFTAHDTHNWDNGNPETPEWKMLEWFNRCLRNFIEAKDDIKHMCGRRGFEKGMEHWYVTYFESDKATIDKAEEQIKNQATAEENTKRYVKSYSDVVAAADKLACKTTFVNTKIAQLLSRADSTLSTFVNTWNFKCGKQVSEFTLHDADGKVWMQQGQEYNVYCGNPELSHCVDGKCSTAENIVHDYTAGAHWKAGVYDTCTCPNGQEYRVAVAEAGQPDGCEFGELSRNVLPGEPLKEVKCKNVMQSEAYDAQTKNHL